MLNVAYNFGNKTKCPLCKIGEDNQKHLIECIVIKLNCHEISYNTDSQSEDIFTENITKLNKISQLLQVATRKRDEILEK